jgi:hypothetical protein
MEVSIRHSLGLQTRGQTPIQSWAKRFTKSIWPSILVGKILLPQNARRALSANLPLHITAICYISRTPVTNYGLMVALPGHPRR